MAAAALVPALCEPANSQFFLPKAMGRMVFSKQLVITFRQSKKCFVAKHGIEIKKFNQQDHLSD
jgi:hypothetical protein